MPGVMARYYVPGDQEAAAVDEAGDKERRARKELIDRYWRYYQGDHDAPLNVRPGEHDDNVFINLCGQAIDKLVAFFAPDSPTVTAPGETRQDDTKSAAQQALDGFWQQNELETFLVELGMAGFVPGHAFVKLLLPDTDGEHPDVAVLDARHVTVFWDISNVKRVLWYRLQWEMDSETKRRQDIVPLWLLADEPQYDPLSEWVIIEYEQSRKTSGKWQEQTRDEWNYPFSPIVQWKNAPLPHEFYGQSDLRHWRLNDAVNFIATNTARIIKFHAHPTTFVTGANMDNVKATSIDGVWELPEGAQVNNLEMQSDLGSSMRMYDLLRGAFFTEGRVVDWASHKDKVGALTNFALRVLFGDMVDLIDTKHRLYGRGLAEISRRALWLMGHPFPTDQRPAVAWKDPLPKSRIEELQAAQLEQQLGFTSNRTLAATIDRDYATEQKQREQEEGDGARALGDMLARVNQGGGFGPFEMPMQPNGAALRGNGQ